MPGDTPPVDAQMDVGPKIEHEVPNEVFRSDIAPLKQGRFYPSQLLHASNTAALEAEPHKHTTEARN